MEHSGPRTECFCNMHVSADSIYGFCDDPCNSSSQAGRCCTVGQDDLPNKTIFRTRRSSEQDDLPNFNACAGCPHIQRTLRNRQRMPHAPCLRQLPLRSRRSSKTSLTSLGMHEVWQAEVRCSGGTARRAWAQRVRTAECHSPLHEGDGQRPNF